MKTNAFFQKEFPMAYSYSGQTPRPGEVLTTSAAGDYAAQPVSQYNASMSDLRGALNRVEGIVDLLQVRLSPFMDESASEDDNAKEPHAACEALEQLHTMRRQAYLLEKRLMSLLGRLVI